MAAIALTSTTVRKVAPGPAEIKEYVVITPATADSADTVDVSSLIADIKALYAWDETSGDQVTATESSGVVTIDAAGGTTNHTYGIVVWGYGTA